MFYGLGCLHSQALVRAHFVLSSPVIHPDSLIKFRAENKKARKKKDLNVEYDKLEFLGGGKLTNEDIFEWVFSLQDKNLSDSYIENGPHVLRVRFSGQEWSDSMTVLIRSFIPAVRFGMEGDSAQQFIAGTLDSEFAHPSESLFVEVVFNYDDFTKSTNLPVTRRIENGRVSYSFNSNIQLPDYEPSDDRFDELFFGLRIRDQAGNTYYRQEPYSSFIAPGEKRFGVQNIADLRLAVRSDEIGNSSDSTVIDVELFPKSKVISELEDGSSPIQLVVTKRRQECKAIRMGEQS